MDSEIMSMNFSYSFTLKIHWSFWIIWKALLYWIICLTNTGRFHYTVSKKNIYLYHHWLHHRSFWKLGNCQGHNGGFKFSKILTFAWKLKIYHWQQMQSISFLEVTGSLCSFMRKCLPKSQVWITIVCQSFFQVDMVFHEKSS